MYKTYLHGGRADVTGVTWALDLRAWYGSEHHVSSHTEGVRTFSVPKPSVQCKHTEHLPETSGVRGVADEIGGKPAIEV